MRILVVSQYFWPESFRINEIVEYLSAKGHDVTVLTGQPNYPEGTLHPAYRADPDRFSEFHGAKIVRVPHWLRGDNSKKLLLNYVSFALSGLTFGAARLAGRSFDVIFVCQLSPVTVALPAILQRHLKRAPLAIWVLDLWPESLSAIGAMRSPVMLNIVGRVVSFIYRRCDSILVQSRSFLSKVESRGARSDAIAYFPAWAEGTFEESGENVSPAPEVANFRDTFNVMFAGNLGEAQDLPTVLAAADALRDRKIRWLIVGDGRAASALRAEIASRGLDGQVIMLGRHDVTRMPSFFVAADALLVSLKDEPLFAMTIPGKIQNYMRSGRPIIAMLSGEGATVIAESGAGVVTPPGDAVALARSVAALADLPELEREKMAVLGRNYCLREFDRSLLFARLERLIEDLAAKDGSPR